MIRFVRLKNAYGIKQIKNIDLLNGQNTLIYASNGTMKSSFSDAMTAISKGETFEDVYTNEQGSFELVSNDITYGIDNMACDDILVFSKPNFYDSLSDDNFARIALSNEKNKELYNLLEIKKNKLKEINEIVSKSVIGRTRTNSKDVNDLLTTFNLESMKDFVSRVSGLDEIDTDLFDGISYADIINPKINNIIVMPELAEQINLYKDIVDSKKDDNIFNSNFTYNSLNNIYRTCIKENYFNAKHKLHIFDRDYDENETKQLLDEQLTLIYKTIEAKSQFDAVSSIFEKNDASIKFIKLLEAKPSILLLNESFNDTQFYFVSVKAKPHLLEIEDKLNELDEIDNKIKVIEECINEESNTWKKMVDIFNARFNIAHFNLKIQLDKVDELNVPRIHQIDKSTGKDLTELQKGRFSTGEKRAIMVLHLMFEIEMMKKNKKSFTVILDDIADSFDYKNKLGILKYIYELMDNTDIQVIALTHNFDFFRCIALKMDTKVTKLSVKNTNGIVTFKKANDKALLDIAFVKEWFNNLKSGNKNANAIDFLSLLPFIRSELTIKDGTKSKRHDNLSLYLHYKKDNPILNQKIKDNEIICNIIKNYFSDEENIPSEEISENIADKTYAELLAEAERQLTNSKQIGEMQLREKMAIAVCVRIECKKFVINKDKRLSDDEDALLSDQINMLKKLNKLNNAQEIKYCEIADTVVNQYLHANSYMYETLIDNSADNMKQALRFFAKQNRVI